jgi:hypothetical protein
MTGYRDERDALRGRVENLEQALGDAEQKLRDHQQAEGTDRVAELKKQLDEARDDIERVGRELTELEGAQQRPAPELAPAELPQRTPRWGLVGLALLGALAVAGAVAVQRSAHGREACRRAVDCCHLQQAGRADAPPCATLVGDDCEAYLERTDCRAPATSGAVVPSASAPATATAAPPAAEPKPKTPSEVPCTKTLALTAVGDTQGAFQKPRRVAAGADGSVVVADETGRVQRFDREGNWGATLRPETKNLPHGSASTDIGTIQGLAVDAKGRVLVSIGYDVVTFDTKGRVVAKRPHVYPETCFREITVARSGLLLVLSACTDVERHALVTMDANGRVLATYPEGPIWQEDSSDKAAVDEAGNIYSPHRFRNQIHVLDPRGKPLRIIHGVDSPGPIALDSRGRMFVRSTWTSVAVLDVQGTRREKLTPCWEGDIRDLAVGSDDQLWIATEKGVVRVSVGERGE